MNKITNIFRALKYRNFRLFFPGLIISQIGIWLQNIAISWLVYEMTNSALLMGIIMFFNAIPLFAVSPFAGVIIDKFNKHKLLMTIQILFALQAFLISIITLTGHIKIIYIILLGAMLNIIASIDIPLRQSTFVNLVDDKKDLSNAISLNSTCFNIARLLGPIFAGILIAKTSVGICFLINFLCFLPSIFLVKAMKITDIKDEHVKNESILEGLKEGIDYAFHDNYIFILLVYLAVFSFLGMIYPMLMPIYTKDVLAQNADILGRLMGMAGIGALISSLILSYKTTIRGLLGFMCSAFILMGAGFIILSLTTNLNTALIGMLIIGFGTTGGLTPANTLLQTFVDDDKRGRVMSLHAICYVGPLSVSNFFAGTLTHAIGISKAFGIIGILIVICALYFYRKIKLIQTNRNLYSKLC